MGKVRWTEEAVHWMEQIHDYIARDNPQAAQRVVLGIYENAESLSEFPERGYKYHGLTDRNIRIILFKHNRIAYLVSHDRDVTILGVYHGSLDISRYLA
jgi:plasmid stabilization system protein ParE